MIEGAEISPPSVSIECECTQHRESGWRGCHRVQYQTYLNLDSHGLPDAVSFAYGDCIAVGCRSSALFVRRVSGSGEADVDVEDS